MLRQRQQRHLIRRDLLIERSEDHRGHRVIRHQRDHVHQPRLAEHLQRLPLGHADAHTTRTDARDAKNRYGMPPEIEMPNDPSQMFNTIWQYIQPNKES